MTMTFGGVYKKVVELGKKADPRSKMDLDRFMKYRKKAYEKLKTDEEKELHKDRLWNPYDDTRIVFGNPKRKVSVVFVGIDVEVQDLVMISQLNDLRAADGKKPIDMVMTHHPEGYALGGLSAVMDDIQVEILRQAGVPVNITEKVLASRVKDVAISISSDNLHRSMDCARLLDLPFMCCHTPADNNAYQIIKKAVDKAKPYTLEEVVKVLKKIPVYKKAMTLFDKVIDIQIGSSDSRAGKIMIGGFTGGTDGNPDILEYVVNTAGVGTSIDMHMSKKHRDLAEKHRLNTIMANHMASDSLGMQVMIDMMRKEGMEVITGSGIIESS